MKTDFCVVGSGIAGMSLALHLSSLGSVVLVSKSELISGSTPLAQGGIAGVHPDHSMQKSADSFESHYDDTMKAGRYANDPNAVRVLVESAPCVLDDLKKWGIEFSEGLHLEGGHSHHRIFHTGDTTGKTIVQGLAKKVREISAKSGNIEIIEDSVLLDFIPLLEGEGERSEQGEQSGKKLKSQLPPSPPLRGGNIFSCFFNTKTQKNITIESQKIFLATGGYASLFENSTTTVGGIGDGISVFIQRGGKTKNLGDVQFHPTVLSLPRTPKLLLSEALRGVGAKIVNRKEEEIVAPLLPRDIVAQEIFEEEQQGERIFLDCRAIQNFSEHFPSIHEHLMREFFLDPETDLLPITPAAHYCMGGIETDIYGRTNIPNVFAVGECAHTGVHGKNRLASNSLLEGLVFARQVFEWVKKIPLFEGEGAKRQGEQSGEKLKSQLPPSPPLRGGGALSFIPSSPESINLGKQIQNICSKYLGISRTPEKLQKGRSELQKIPEKHLGTREKNMKILGEAIFDDTLSV